MSAPWKELEAIAQTEVGATLASLPAPLRRQAAPLPVTYQARPDAAETGRTTIRICSDCL